jgi:hypothetical protein
MSAILKSWKPSRRDGSSSLYRLIGDFVSQEIAFVRLFKVFVAIVHRGGCPIPRQTRAAGSGGCSSHLRQRQVALRTLQMRGHDRPSEGLRPLWRIEPDLESDGDSG